MLLSEKRRRTAGAGQQTPDRRRRGRVRMRPPPGGTSGKGFHRSGALPECFTGGGRADVLFPAEPWKSFLLGGTEALFRSERALWTFFLRGGPSVREELMNVFLWAHTFVASMEGGYADHPSDPGGATNYGISLRFLRSQGLDRGDIDGDGGIDADDIKALTPADAMRMMRRSFWEPLELDRVPPACAVVLYDTAVNMGPGYARRMAQQALGVDADGIWGPITWRAFAACDERRCALNMCRLRKKRYRELAGKNPALNTFLCGWLRRVEALEQYIARENGSGE